MDSRVLNFFDRVTGEQLHCMPPADAQLYCAFRLADIQARLKLITIGQCLGDSAPGAIILLSAVLYLMDRRNYTPLRWSETV